MTAVSDRTEVFEPSEADLRIAVRNALKLAGVDTFAQLAAQAETGRFTSSRARRAWVAIGGFERYA